MFDDNSNVQFPWKLHVLVEGAERNGYSHIISWLPAGNAFKVHDKIAFAEVLMPKYFHSNKYKSFQRNLNLWCFQTLTKEPNKGAIFHPHFLRGIPDRCHLMRRIKVKKNSQQRMSLAELRASAPPVTLPSAASLVMKPNALPQQMKDLNNAAQLVLLAQQENAQKQQQQQNNQLFAFLSNSRGHAAQSLPGLFQMPSQKLAGPPSALNSMILNQLAQTQMFAPSAPAPAAINSSLELDRLRMQLSLALLTTNCTAPANMNSIAGLLPNKTTSSSE